MYTTASYFAYFTFFALRLFIMVIMTIRSYDAGSTYTQSTYLDISAKCGGGYRFLNATDKTFTIYSAIECAELCDKEKFQSFDFHEVENSCRLHQNNVTVECNGLEKKSGWSYYLKVENPKPASETEAPSAPGFSITSTAMSLSAAAASCTLVMIKTPAEQKALELYLASVITQGTQVWIGGQMDGAAWKWVDGTPIATTYWRSAQVGNYPCLAVWIQDDTEKGKWVTFQCANNLKAICKN